MVFAEKMEGAFEIPVSCPRLGVFTINLNTCMVLINDRSSKTEDPYCAENKPMLSTYGSN